MLSTLSPPPYKKFKKCTCIMVLHIALTKKLWLIVLVHRNLQIVVILLCLVAFRRWIPRTLSPGQRPYI